MKTIHGFLLAAAMSSALVACNNDRTADSDTDVTADTEMTAGTTADAVVEPGTYVDLNTGKEVYIVRDESYSYPFSYLLFIALYMSVVFEWVMPQFSAAYTRDTWDVVMYFGGGLFYYFVHEKRIILKEKMPS